MFEGVSFTLAPGQVLQVTGANGAGKTTLMRILATVLRPTSGSVVWEGKVLPGASTGYRADMVYLGHQAGIKLDLSPRENLRWLSALAGARRGEIDTALAAVGLAGYEEVLCGSLSAGQQRRVALARLLLHPARLWLLDEPLTAIDRQGVQSLQQLMARHLAGGGAIVITTHQTLELEGVRVLELERYAA